MWFRADLLLVFATLPARVRPMVSASGLAPVRPMASASGVARVRPMVSASGLLLALGGTQLLGCAPALNADDDDVTGDDDDATDDDDVTGDDDDVTGGETSCPLSIDGSILACVADLQGDPESSGGLYLLDLLLLCGDAEPVAVAYDSHCAAVPADPICALDYGVFVAEVLPTCIERAREALFAPVCLFPPEYRQLLIAPGVTRLDRRFVTDPSVLSSAEVDQLLATSAALGFAASSAAEALAATDDDGFEQLSVLAVGTDRVIELWTAHYGDTRVGQAWFRGGLTRVADVQDGFFSRCAVERAIEGQPCAGPADPICGAGHQCTGMVFDEGGSIIAGGVCASTTAVPGQGDVCAGDGDCSVGAVCSPYGAGTAEGQCVPGWMRHSFPATGALRDLVPGGELRLPIAVSGLATVPTVAHLDLVVGQLGVNGLRVALENPSGTQVPVIETTGAPTVDLSLVWQEVAVAGDEAVNGPWTLVIEDTGGAASGTVYALELTLDSRYD